jgi:hypothetical protein
MRGKLMPLRARESVPRVALLHFSLPLLPLLPLLLVVLLVVVSSMSHAGSEPTRHQGQSSLLTNCCVQVGTQLTCQKRLCDVQSVFDNLLFAVGMS